MASSRYVLNSNKQWLVGISDMTMRVLEEGRDTNTENIPEGDTESWPRIARIGDNKHCTHRELEVFGVVFSGKKLEQLIQDSRNHRILLNLEGFMLMWFDFAGKSNGFTPGGWSKDPVRRLNDLFDWSKYGCHVPDPVELVWDRFQLGTGRLMTGDRQREKDAEIQKLKEELAEAKRQCEEKQKEKDAENQELKKQLEDKDKELKEKDEQIDKQSKELEERNKELEEAMKALEEKEKEVAELKDKQDADAEELKKLREDIATKEKQIRTLKAAMRELIG